VIKDTSRQSFERAIDKGQGMRRLLAQALFAVALMFSPLPVRADDLCRGSEANDMLKDCLYKHFLATELKMSDAYKAAVLRVEASGLGKTEIRDWTRALQASQGAWTAFREVDCGRTIDFETFQTPEMQGIMWLRCRITITEDRLTALTMRYLKP
jgi:uncharacterized protein YecT (DUF1311 family)